MINAYGKRLSLGLIGLLILGLVGCTGAQGNGGAGAQGSAGVGAQATQPVQPAPATAVPPTSAPPVAAPATVAPPTVGRPTTAPATAVPPTMAPAATVAPPTAQASAQGAMAEALAVTLTCPTPTTLMPAQTEGPYYKPNPPQRTSLLEPGVGGTKMILTGFVVTPDCRPIAGARVDFWQADDKGEYDNTGYRFRGYQLTDANGRYSLETVLPGLYPGRTSHIHVKITAPNRPTLTSQVYFPEVAANAKDGGFDTRLAVKWLDTKMGKVAMFNFVVRD